MVTAIEVGLYIVRHSDRNTIEQLEQALSTRKQEIESFKISEDLLHELKFMERIPAIRHLHNVSGWSILECQDFIDSDPRMFPF